MTSIIRVDTQTVDNGYMCTVVEADEDGQNTPSTHVFLDIEDLKRYISRTYVEWFKSQDVWFRDIPSEQKETRNKYNAKRRGTGDNASVDSEPSVRDTPTDTTSDEG